MIPIFSHVEAHCIFGVSLFYKTIANEISVVHTISTTYVVVPKILHYT